MLVALLNIRVNALITGIFLLIELLALLVVMVLGFADRARPLGELLLQPVAIDAGALVTPSAASIGVAASIAVFAMNGYGAAVYFAEEMHEAPRRIGTAIMASFGLALAFEALPLIAVLLAKVDLPALLTAEDPFGLMVRARGGEGVADLVALGVVLAIVNAIIACILACARFFYGTARDRCWGPHVDRWMTAIHPRFQSPWAGTLLVGGVGIAACFLPLKLLLVLNGMGLVAIYGGIAIAAIVGRRSGATAHAPYRMPFYPIAPIVTLLALAYIAWTSWFDPEEGRPGLIATGLQILAAALYYRFVLRRGGKEWKVHR
jgi:amino acid transporter